MGASEVALPRSFPACARQPARARRCLRLSSGAQPAGSSTEGRRSVQTAGTPSELERRQSPSSNELRRSRTAFTRREAYAGAPRIVLARKKVVDIFRSPLYCLGKSLGELPADTAQCGRLESALGLLADGLVEQLSEARQVL